MAVSDEGLLLFGRMPSCQSGSPSTLPEFPHPLQAQAHPQKLGAHYAPADVPHEPSGPATQQVHSPAPCTSYVACQPHQQHAPTDGKHADGSAPVRGSEPTPEPNQLATLREKLVSAQDETRQHLAEPVAEMKALKVSKDEITTRLGLTRAEVNALLRAANSEPKP